MFGGQGFNAKYCIHPEIHIGNLIKAIVLQTISGSHEPGT